ncbi:unnamed protein product [Pseudo-nitzschia multistriata]|uniref:CST complex subunit Stn1 N-terminal domain-containing protein n=1 Tax=Pseudo-nitzschia multistriata TaxID=183589 RepID=A0A448ZDV7_9STRA|nr:unnamed protein product [Pseudo-nitzschia multistriata]
MFEKDGVGDATASGIHTFLPDSNLNFVAGISPMYWSYVRMTVIDVLNLKLKDGINWMSSPPAKEDFGTPVSKCLLVGYVVYATQRRDGSMAYVVDDGTGFIDCVHWCSNSNDNTEDIYHLPSLSDDLDDHRDHGPFHVGEPVRVYGKIECVASTTKKTTKTSTKSHNGNGDEVLVVREIQSNLMERVEDILLVESHHWMQLCSIDPVDIRSCLEAVGPQIRSQIENRINLPAADDTSCSWRVFGMSCRCDLPYMEDLLYCHCQSKAEAMDPSYRFRDALLIALLSMQSKTASMLKFKYKDIRNNDSLELLALKELSQQKRTENNVSIDKIFLKTFRALRHDGILYLLNSNTDEYLFITRSKVLEPFVRTLVSNEIGASKPKNSNFVSYDKAPAFISRVHNERLLYIKRLINEGASTPYKTHGS